MYANYTEAYQKAVSHTKAIRSPHSVVSRNNTFRVFSEQFALRHCPCEIVTTVLYTPRKAV